MTNDDLTRYAERLTRLLDAGATIAGKAVCEYFCFSGGSHTASTAAGVTLSPASGFQPRWSHAAAASAATLGARTLVRQWMPSRPVHP